MKSVVLKSNLIHAGNLILVNSEYPYQENSVERTLLPVNPSTNSILLEANIVKLLSSIMDKLNGWERITAVSGWRSAQEQEKIYMQSLKDNGTTFTKKYVASPGHSEHQTGLAIDLAKKKPCIDFLRPDFPYTGIFQDFRQSAIPYGFIERYPKNKESVTGIAHEPWHFRYVGTPHAEIMEKHNFVLEEYIGFLKNYPYGKKSYSFHAKDMCIAVSYLKANRIADTRFVLDETTPYSVSGNNIDGYIITEWRKKNEDR